MAELIQDRDNVVRVAKIRVPTKKGTTIFSHPLRLLIPLEISCAPAEILTVGNPGKSGKDMVNSGTGINVNCRPHRNAAIIGEIRRRENS